MNSTQIIRYLVLFTCTIVCTLLAACAGTKSSAGEIPGMVSFLNYQVDGVKTSQRPKQPSQQEVVRYLQTVQATDNHYFLCTNDNCSTTRSTKVLNLASFAIEQELHFIKGGIEQTRDTYFPQRVGLESVTSVKIGATEVGSCSVRLASVSNDIRLYTERCDLRIATKIGVQSVSSSGRIFIQSGAEPTAVDGTMNASSGVQVMFTAKKI